MRIDTSLYQQHGTAVANDQGVKQAIRDIAFRAHAFVSTQQHIARDKLLSVQKVDGYYVLFMGETEIATFYNRNKALRAKSAGNEFIRRLHFVSDLNFGDLARALQDFFAVASVPENAVAQPPYPVTGLPSS